MSVPYCHMCEKNQLEKDTYGDVSLAQGIYCPICHRPVCRFHMARVRWRWKTRGGLDSAYICKECKNTYQHRLWDSHNRDWID